MMAALARVVHNRQGAADPEYNRREHNQQRGLHGDLATAGPPNLPRRPNYRGSNEPTVNVQAPSGQRRHSHCTQFVSVSLRCSVKAP